MDSPSARTKNLSVSVPKDVHSIIEGIVSSFSPTLDLSKRGLEHLSEEIFKISHLKQLHLQRNELSIIPKDFFQLLPNLVWLDLRHNKIKAIPSGIGSHKNLKTLLMEKNPIKALPVELGNLMSLKALNLRSCPLEFPPPQVIHKGLPAILAFLRTWALEHSASLQQQAVPMQRANSLKELSRAEAGEDPQGKDYRFPTMEKLNLAEVAESSPDLSEDWSSEEGMKQFWKLRQEIVANEKAEILSNQLLPTQLPLELQSRAKAHLHKPKYSFRLPLKKPYNSRKKTPSFKSMFPEIPSYETQIQIKKDEEKHLAALKELKEKQALIEQRKREKTMLQKWRQRAKGTKKKEVPGDARCLPKKDMIIEKAPFVTKPAEENKEVVSLEKKKAIQLKVAPYRDEPRTSKDREIEERIKHHMEALRQRRRKARGTREETTRKLRDDAPRQDPRLKKEYRFTAFTGEVALQSPMSQPQNIFSNMKF
ncbi:leucine-rich repeat-containing protein 27 isoform X2 [Sminthopsis crassicaudata]|uniref:leucine-rich repeat-containing protein 27 isoform X2 n=1 Tax=Sminthopsis crassicaudata TaxID=9301 RepID=UPI003D6952BE